MSTPKLDVRTLSVSFGPAHHATRVVHDVSFSIAPGEAYGLVGESGCGKSTILRAISGLNSAWTGAIALDGKALAPRRTLEQHRRVQMVFQDPFGSLHPRHTIDAILAEPLAIHGLDDRNGRVQRALEQVGLGGAFRFRFPHQLSGGQRQRVAIARAMILEPRLLLLDEPTSALDVSIQAEVLNLLEDLRRDRGLTYLLVSHDLAVVAHMCERVGVMRQGRLLEECTADDLRAGRLREAYTKRFLAASEGYDRAMARQWDTLDEERIA